MMGAKLLAQEQVARQAIGARLEIEKMRFQSQTLCRCRRDAGMVRVQAAKSSDPTSATPERIRQKIFQRTRFVAPQ
jgi:hypothetical protein